MLAARAVCAAPIEGARETVGQLEKSLANARDLFLEETRQVDENGRKCLELLLVLDELTQIIRRHYETRLGVLTGVLLLLNRRFGGSISGSGVGAARFGAGSEVVVVAGGI